MRQYWNRSGLHEVSVAVITGISLGIIFFFMSHRDMRYQLVEVLGWIEDEPFPQELAVAYEASPAAPSAPVPEGMALVPAGFFLMGSDTGQSNERPAHPVLLDAFYLDRFEVTNAQYRQCVQSGGCTEGQRHSLTVSGYRDDPDYDHYPVIAVTRDQAQAYCIWAGKRLPTEAEWEYAARGPQEQRWTPGNHSEGRPAAAGSPEARPVGSDRRDITGLGIFDLAGNVGEWVADVYSADFYANSPARNPHAAVGAQQIYRGGSYDQMGEWRQVASRRNVAPPGFTAANVGFRCARDVLAPVEREPAPEVVAAFCQAYRAYKPMAPCP